MFEASATLVPADWQPIPDAVREALGPWDFGDDAAPDTADTLVSQAASSQPNAGVLSVLAGIPVDGLSVRAQGEALAAWGRVAGHVDAVRLAAVAAIAGPERAFAGPDFTPNFVSVCLNLTLPAADRLIALARHLTTTLMETHRAMCDGRVTLAQAAVLHEATAALPDDIARSVEARVLDRAQGQDRSSFRAAVRRAVAALDPGWEAAARANRSETRVDHVPADDGTADLVVHAAAEVTSIIHTALEAYAERNRQALGGTVADRMVAGLTDWAQLYLTQPGAPTRHGRPLTVNVVIDLPTLLGMTDHPAEIPGVGAIPAEAARQLAAEGAPLRRLVIDPTTGHLLDYGRRTYTAPPDLAAYLIHANVHSMGPHSHVPAARCDLDHCQSWDNGGQTNPDNLTPCDRRWHRAKTFSDWSYVRNFDGSVTWTGPGGVTCRVEPFDYRLGP